MGSAKLRVLLVEDESSDAELLQFSLRGSCPDQFDITHARDWSEAVKHLRQSRFDVLLLDLSLPDSRGTSTFLRARAEAPQLPILVLTGNEDEAIAVEAARHGIEDYLVKGPRQGRQIGRSIRYAIERSQAARHRVGLSELLKLFALGSPRQEYLPSIVKLLKDWCGCHAVGVRLAKEKDRLPYAAQQGFSPQFLRHENRLCLRTGDCSCVRLIMGRQRPEDAHCTSPGGSLVCNHTSECVAHLGAPPEQARQVACVAAGYESLVHTPLRYREHLVGSLHLADLQPGKFPPQVLAFVEAAALIIAEALFRLKVEESLLQSEARFRSLFERHASIMLLVAPQTGAIVDVNAAAVAFYGYSREQFRTMKFNDLHYLPAEAAADRTGRSLARQRSFWVLMHRLASGETRMVEAHSSPIQVGAERLLFFIIHDITERTLLQEEVLEIGEKERRRVGQDLHDSLGGKLTGTALMSKALAQRLAALQLPEARLAEEIVECINDSIGQTRSIARGLWPAELTGSGLPEALAEFARESERRSGIRCRVETDPQFQVQQPFVALHLFRLALEAISNALRHAEAQNISIALATTPTHVSVEVRDDGKGMPAEPPGNGGLGLRTMKYRAEAIGGLLIIGPSPSGGTVVSCLVPLEQVRGHINLL